MRKRKCIALRICTGYSKVGHSPLFLYYELLAMRFVFTDFQPITQRYKQRTACKASLQSIQPLRKI